MPIEEHLVGPLARYGGRPPRNRSPIFGIELKRNLVNSHQHPVSPVTPGVGYFHLSCGKLASTVKIVNCSLVGCLSRQSGDSLYVWHSTQVKNFLLMSGDKPSIKANKHTNIHLTFYEGASTIVWAVVMC